MVFEHREDDVVFTCRFRADIWDYIEAKMHNKQYKKKYGRATTHLPAKSVHTVLDEQLRKLMKG